MDAPMDSELLANLGKKDTSPFGCEAIEAQSGKYQEHKCGGSQSCHFEVDIPSDNIHETR